MNKTKEPFLSEKPFIVERVRGVRCCGTRYFWRSRVVVHEQLASEGSLNEVACEVAHLAFKVRLC